jgi:toxin ParE1/3/4
LKLRWTQLALNDFEQAHDYIAEENPEAAREIAQRIFDATKTLLEHPRIGRVGKEEGSREWRVDKTPYLLVYSINEDVIELWRVWHMSQGTSSR